MTLLLEPPVWMQFPLVALGAWRIAILLVLESGPEDIFQRLRNLMGIAHDDQGVPISWPTHLPGSLFACIWCLSFWTSLALYGILWVAPGVVVVVGTWGAATYLEVLRSGMVNRR